MKDWDKVFIGDCFDFKNGLNKEKEYFGKGTPIINYTDVYSKRGLFKEDISGRVTLSADEIRRFKVEKNDVLFTRTSETPEEVGFTSVLLEDIEDCVFSGFVLRARPRDNCFYPPYCKYCFMTPEVREEIAKSCTYTTRALTNGRVLSAIEISLPPLAEQRRIAEALSDVDELIASLEKLIAKKKAIKQGAMQELLTGKRRLPGFSGEWIALNLNSLGQFVSGNGFPMEYQGCPSGKYPFYKVSDFSNIGNERMLKKANNYISQVVAEHLGCDVIPKNSIVFAKIGAAIFLERKKLTTLDCCIDNNMMSFQPCCSVSAHFMWYVFQTIRFGELVAATALPSLSGKAIGEISISLPPTRVEQEAIADVLLDLDYNMGRLSEKLKKYRQIKQGMMQQLLTGKIRLQSEV